MPCCCSHKPHFARLGEPASFLLCISCTSCVFSFCGMSACGVIKWPRSGFTILFGTHELGLISWHCLPQNSALTEPCKAQESMGRKPVIICLTHTDLLFCQQTTFYYCNFSEGTLSPIWCIASFYIIIFIMEVQNVKIYMIPTEGALNINKCN